MQTAYEKLTDSLHANQKLTHEAEHADHSTDTFMGEVEVALCANHQQQKQTPCTVHHAAPGAGHDNNKQVGQVNNG